MATTTYFYNEKGAQIKAHSGKPRRIDVFNRNALAATRVEICTVDAYGWYSEVFNKVNGRWLGYIYRGTCGYLRKVLKGARTLMHCDIEKVSDQEAMKLIKDEASNLMSDAHRTIRWCNPNDEKDSEGRYWLSAYAGAGVYRLIVQNGRIIGSIPGGYHQSCPIGKGIEGWKMALLAVISEKIKGKYNLLKADGSGTYFYLRNEEDAKYLSVKKYNVPSIHGGVCQNIEVK